MEAQSWFNWCKKQLADLAHKMAIQGYSPERIEYLRQTAPKFQTKVDDFLAKIDDTMNCMAEHPESYRFYEDFAQTKKALLEYTNEHREEFIGLHLAETA